jgi:hypothetical protein
MTYPPQQPGPHGQPGWQGQPGPYGTPPGGVPGQPAYGGHPQQPPGPYGAPGQPGGWGQPQQGYGGPPPYGTPPAGLGQPGGYGPPPAPRKRALPWILGGGGALVVIAVVVVLIFTLGGGGGGGTGSPRAVAEAFVAAVNDQKEPEGQIFCDAFVQEGREVAKGLPGGGDVPTDVPDFDVKASLGDVQQNGDNATAVVRFELTSGGESIKGDYNLDIKKEGGDWKICGLEVGNIEIPGLGG